MILLLTTPFPISPEQAPQAAEVRQQPRSARQRAATDLVLRALGGNPSPTIAQELSALGPDLIPFLLQVLTKEGVPVGADPEHPVVLKATPELQGQVLDALAALPREPLLQQLRTYAASTDFAERVACMRVLGRTGTNEQMDLLASLAAPIGPTGLLPSKVRTAFQDALVRILARDSKAFSRFVDLYGRIPQALIFSMIRAAEEQSAPRAIELLAGLLGTRTEADPFLLAEITRLADQSRLPTPREVCALLRRYLADADLQRLRPAVTLAGALEDHEAVPELARLLEHEDAQVCRDARSALKKIVRKDLGRLPGPWTAWYQNESGWWRANSSSIGQDVVGSDPVKAAAAILELGKRRIRRDEAALMLAEGLLRPEPDLVRTCCQALGHLASPLAVPALEKATRHRDLEVSAAAREALAQIRRLPGS
ncbi:MAG: HEAT repeat domain-containing protein [Planctomycetota bacterium]